MTQGVSSVGSECLFVGWLQRETMETKTKLKRFLEGTLRSSNVEPTRGVHFGGEWSCRTLHEVAC